VPTLLNDAWLGRLEAVATASLSRPDPLPGLTLLRCVAEIRRLRSALALCRDLADPDADPDAAEALQAIRQVSRATLAG